jgi:hypothetical protein
LRLLAMLTAGIFPVSAAQALPTEENVQNRFLFVFDTSSGMKSRVDAVQIELNTMLASSLSGQMHAGDSMGVWTIGQTLQPRDYPLVTWNPERAALIASNLTKFVSNQHYTKTVHFEALEPLLNQVVKDSQRLTVLIFCDGATEMAGTPYDAGINKFVREKLDEQKKERQPFVIMLRSQLGQYVGGSVSFPPSPINFVPFPLLPEPPPPPPPTNLPPKPVSSAPVAVAPSLIIVGTHVGTNAALLNEPFPANSPATGIAPTNHPPARSAVTNTATITEPTPPAGAPAKQTNRPAVSAGSAAPTNLAAAVPLASENAGFSNHFLLIVGVGLLIAAVALAGFVWGRSQRRDSSLITHSMEDRK